MALVQNQNLTVVIFVDHSMGAMNLEMNDEITGGIHGSVSARKAHQVSSI